MEKQCFVFNYQPNSNGLAYFGYDDNIFKVSVEFNINTFNIQNIKNLGNDIEDYSYYFHKCDSEIYIKILYPYTKHIINFKLNFSDSSFELIEFNPYVDLELEVKYLQN